ncbi:hypothetical protein E8E13_010949 [Curvularia kusanoi]|uniref:BTB domain-containing protein n=1 Tax=Curvularia kusanoi TaxID=90978 RepID=A0A9P4TJ02_CURKU|nr:hypothetical protein E8E13_010949 [Curvularia kusanoi]
MANATRNTASRDPPRLSAHDACFATVLVGEERKRFIVHKDLLTYHSEFFRSALSGNFKEAAEQTVPLPEDDPDTFEFFVHWLYHKDLPMKDNASTDLLQDWTSEDNGGNLEKRNLIELHVFADRYRVEKLKVRTLEALFRYVQKNDVTLPSNRLICYAYENMPAGSGLLTLLVDVWCKYVEAEEWKDDDTEQLPSPFLISVLKCLTDGARGKIKVRAALELSKYLPPESDGQ